MNLVLNDEILFFNYTLDQVSRGDYLFHTFYPKVAIAPKKAALVEGETFECDVYLASYSLQPNLFTAKINSQKVESRDGVAHFKSKPHSIGKKVIQAELSLQNPATGQITTKKGKYTYEVFPKCSRDCQR